MTPSTGTGVNQSYACALTNKSPDIPGLTRHGLAALCLCVFVDNLKEAADLIRSKFQALLVQKYTTQMYNVIFTRPQESSRAR